SWGLSSPAAGSGALRTLPRPLPTGVVGDRDADPVGRELRHHRAVTTRADAPPGAHAETVQLAPLGEREDLVGMRRWEAALLAPRRLGMQLHDREPVLQRRSPSRPGSH